MAVATGEIHMSSLPEASGSKYHHTTLCGMRLGLASLRLVDLNFGCFAYNFINIRSSLPEASGSKLNKFKEVSVSNLRLASLRLVDLNNFIPVLYQSPVV